MTLKTISISELRRRGRPVPADEVKSRIGEFAPLDSSMPVHEFHKSLINLVTKGLVLVFDVEGELYYMPAEIN